MAQTVRKRAQRNVLEACVTPCQDCVTNAQRDWSVKGINQAGLMHFPSTGDIQEHVIHQCPSGKFGVDCSKTCSKSCKHRTCNGNTGHCLEGCSSHGKTGPLCDQQCPLGKFGVDCSETCSEACKLRTCDGITGHCLEGCSSPGKTGPLCDQQCPSSKFGVDCSETCSETCKLHTCDGITGHCLEGCSSPGKTGPLCDQPCEVGWYGSGCRGTCSEHCIDGVCDSVSGICTDGCVSGWKGVLCSERDCPEGTFGEACSHNCSGNCNYQTCNPTTGDCLHGCTPGNTGHHCNIPCGIGRYGSGCEGTCSEHCVNGVCDSVSGMCIDGCVFGWKGVLCSERELSSKKLRQDTCQHIEYKSVQYQCKAKIGTSHMNSVPTAQWEADSLSYDQHRVTHYKVAGLDQTQRACEKGTYGLGCVAACHVNCIDNSCEPVTGECERRCEGTTCDFGESDTESYIEIYVGVAAFILLGIILGVLVTRECRKRRSLTLDQKHLISTTEDSTIPGESMKAKFYIETKNELFNPNLEKDNTVSTEKVEIVTEDIAGNATVTLEGFMAYLEGKKQQPKLIAFKKEHSILPHGIKAAATVGASMENAKKNRYRNIIPYDHSRVKIKPMLGQAPSDYINASYIDGLDKRRAYVASQGPTWETIQDFWRMVWQLDCCKIVMLTNLVEEGKVKCEQYWPDSGVAVYGEIAVKIVFCETFAHFTIRTFKIKKVIKCWREITQFHFTTWPDCKAPRCAQILVNFRNKVIESKCSGKGPLVVHCSAGVGRTGAFIALDYLLRQAKKTGNVNIYRCVEKLRSYRPNMVQTLTQYVYLHDALAEGLNLSSAKIIPVFKYEETYRNLLDFDPVQKKTNLELMYEVSSDFLEANTAYPPDEEFEVGKANRDKNRYHNILPVETYRPVLQNQYDGRSNYVNAVYLRSYNLQRAFILTQMPLSNTIIEFWRLVQDYETSCIVMLNGIDECGLYWPTKNQVENYGKFRVKRIREEDYTDYTVTTLSFALGGSNEKYVKLFRFNLWSDTRPTPPKQLLPFIQETLNCQKERGNKPMIVHCKDGAERSGLFAVLAAVVDRMKTDQNITIPCFIRDMRARRPQIIPTLAQFQFCYDAISCYLQDFDEEAQRL
ncbi:hypothetical protein ScPMuIL_001929 [Solemya velum]